MRNASNVTGEVVYFLFLLFPKPEAPRRQEHRPEAAARLIKSHAASHSSPLRKPRDSTGARSAAGFYRSFCFPFGNQSVPF
jgi:hypothetical protein